MAGTPALVSDADAVTSEWLTDVLGRAGVAPPGVSVSTFEATPVGTGKLGENVRFALTWAGAEPGTVPASVVGKFPSADPTSRQAGLLTGIYVREVSFYQELAHRVAMRIPACHRAEIDPSTGDFVLVFEDITPARQGDQVTGCSVDEAASAMEQLALLHGSLWGDRDLSGRTWLGTRSADGGQSLADMYQVLLRGFLDQYADRLSEQATETAQRLAGHVTDWLSLDREPFTLLHGDFRLENMLFGSGPAAPPLTTLDWQTPTVGPGPSDAAYFLGAGLHTDVRRTHEGELLETYRRGLAAQGVELGADECWAIYRANTFAGLHMAVVASVLVGRDPRSDEMFLAMAERHAAHVVDLEAFALFD
jgi:hypothetical protein